MKLMPLFILTFLTVSCAHKHGHDHTHCHMPKKTSLLEDKERIEGDLKALNENSKWLSDFLADTSDELSRYKVQSDKLAQEIKNSSGMALKKLTLKKNRMTDSFEEEYSHRKEDLLRVRSLIKEIKKLRKSIENHEGHNH